jgi:hypothetical protein
LDGYFEIGRYPQAGETFGLPVREALSSIGYLHGFMSLILTLAARSNGTAAKAGNTEIPAVAWLEPQPVVRCGM